MFNEIDRDQGGTISTGELCKYLRTKLKKLDISGNLQQQIRNFQPLAPPARAGRVRSIE